MKAKVIFFPLLVKIGLILIVLQSLYEEFKYSYLFDYNYNTNNILLYLSGCFIILVALYYSIFVCSMLKIEDNNIYIYQYVRWRIIYPETIKKVSYFSGGLSLFINNINIINRIIVPVYSSRGREIANYLTRLIEKKNVES